MDTDFLPAIKASAVLGTLILNILFSVFLAKIMQRFFDLPAHLPRWNTLINKIWVPGATLSVIMLIFGVHTDVVVNVFWSCAMATIIAVLVQLRDYKPARTILTAVAPYALHLAITTILRLLNSGLLNYFEDFFESWRAFGWIWLFSFIWIARNQKKALAKEQLLREEEEKAKQRIAAQNTELERMVVERTAALTQQAEALQSTLTELRTTQAQLIQAEKMASLGELTAGIAHEIQNPLNFVNNFAEVSVELCQELREEVEKVGLAAADKEYMLEILNDLSHNQAKINQHGHRAASIVKGMLQHSRASTGERQATDLNDLADEYLRLAYHGLRAKDKTFNATLTTSFDETVGTIEVLPQDLGRVLLNLFSNAFYAVQQRQNQDEPSYQPTVTVSTKRENGQVKICVRDNGTGIPEAVRQKIFQPFFTTKPSGEGTGLGLSLSYDIITKAHGGTLAVESQVGKGTEFTISLPS